MERSVWERWLKGSVGECWLKGSGPCCLRWRWRRRVEGWCGEVVRRGGAEGGIKDELLAGVLEPGVGRVHVVWGGSDMGIRG